MNLFLIYQNPIFHHDLVLVEAVEELNLLVVVSHLVHFHFLESVEVAAEEVYEQVPHPLVLHQEVVEVAVEPHLLVLHQEVDQLL
jgi:hypothetical protein